MGRLYMETLDDPFAAVEKELSAHRLGGSVAAIMVDFHAEASSEKMAMGHYLDGRVSAVGGYAYPCADG
jgi:calcineurin-like phosphoesterase